MDNNIEDNCKKLLSLTTQFIFVEYYSHLCGDCFKIINEFSSRQQEKFVLCLTSEGIGEALQKACEIIENEKDKYFHCNR